MKNLTVIAALVTTLVSAHAEAAKFHFDCESQETGFRFIANPAYGEIVQFDENGAEIGSFDSMTAKYTFVETFPVKTIIEFVHEEGNVEFTIEEKGGRITAEHDDDSSIVCRKVR